MALWQQLLHLYFPQVSTVPENTCPFLGLEYAHSTQKAYLYSDRHLGVATQNLEAQEQSTQARKLFAKLRANPKPIGIFE